MVTGTIPFSISHERDLGKIVYDSVSYPKWMKEVTISFLSKLLDKNPNKRTDI